MVKLSQTTKKIFGLAATIISGAIISFWSFWGIMEFFHEGWHSVSLGNSLVLFFIQYLSPAVVFIVLSLLAMKYKKMGLVLFVLLAIFATFFFAGASFQTVHLLITMPLIGLGLLYFFGEVEHEKLALFLIIGMPILIVLIGGIPQFVRVSQRVDDGNYGARVVDCQNHPTLWAPRGPGFPEEGVNWTDAEYVCAHLNEEGDALSDEALSLWRLPSVEEAVRCQMIHNENAGGVWNEETRQAEYEKRPDKETPLWVPDAEVIYYWTSDMSKETEDQAYIIDYKGGVFDKDIHSSPNYRSFRCVRDVPRDFTVAEVLEESCVQESDCIVPGDWAMRSVCPYETRCLEQRCTVVCPEPFSHPTP